VLTLIHFVIFKDAHHLVIFLLADIAFLPIEVLLVTIIIHRLLSEREKRARLEKMNMVIGVFFSEVGIELLASISRSDPGLDGIRKELMVTGVWTESEFLRVDQCLQDYEYGVDIGRADLRELKRLLVVKVDFLLRLLENPNMLEHESFTELLWAVFHLADELTRRENLERVPDTDLTHLGNDVKRVVALIGRQWVDYMKHMEKRYPYLFHLAVRTNPFDQTASVIVR
jgi:hypothetical protein